jgi:hypothetical protein
VQGDVGQIPEESVLPILWRDIDFSVTGSAVAFNIPLKGLIACCWASVQMHENTAVALAGGKRKLEEIRGDVNDSDDE